jgi:hypothetical protein
MSARHRHATGRKTTLSGQELMKVREGVQRQICADSKLWPTSKVIGVAISWYTSRKECGEARPGIETLASAAGVNVRTANKCINQLEARRHYLIKRGGGRHRANIYIPTLWRADPTGGKLETPPSEAGYSAAETLPSRTQNRALQDPKPCPPGHPNLLEPIIEPKSGTRSLSAPIGLLARPEEKEAVRQAREKEGQDEKTTEPIARPSVDSSEQSECVSRDKRPTLEEMRVRYNMPDLGKTVRRMH